jgi:uncharacterized protein YbjQ (UPF0145 family)
MFSGIVRNLFAPTSAGVMQQSARTASQSLPLSIFRSYSQSQQSYESDREFFVTEKVMVPGYKIERVKGQVLGKCGLLFEAGHDDGMSHASRICESSARQDMIESAQRMRANAIVGVRYRGHVEGCGPDYYVVRECKGDAVILIKDEDHKP